MAGGFLLLGGRLADMYGRRRMFLIGVVLFAVASTTSGAAISSSMLVSSRFAQGLGEAVAGPAALGMIPVLFPENRERMKALGIWGGLAGLGGVFGSVISGLLTNVDWRWIFYVNIPVAVLALVLAPRVVPESRMVRTSRRIDFGGAITATGGLVAVVDGLLNAASHSWGSWQVLLPLLGGVGLLAVMVAWEARYPEPLVPLRFFANRTRATVNFVTMFLTASFIAYFYMTTLYMQQVLGYSPLKTGLLYLPFGVGTGIGVGLCTTLMPRLGVKAMLTVGYLGSAVGMFMTSLIHVNSSFVGGLLPGMIVLGVFAGICFPALVNGALHQVTGQDSGLASGVQNTLQQAGTALGLATLVTLALRHAANQIGHGVLPLAASTSGYVLSFRVAAILLAIGGVLMLFLIERVTATVRNPLAEVPAEEEPTASSIAR
jgi:MFS family permease